MTVYLTYNDAFTIIKKRKRAAGIHTTYKKLSLGIVSSFCAYGEASPWLWWKLIDCCDKCCKTRLWEKNLSFFLSFLTIRARCMFYATKTFYWAILLGSYQRHKLQLIRTTKSTEKKSVLFVLFCVWWSLYHGEIWMTVATSVVKQVRGG